MFNFEEQMKQVKQQAAQAGFSGTAIVDVHPKQGIVRIKVNTNPPESLVPFMTNYARMLSVFLSGMNIEARVHFADEEKR